MLGLAKPGQKFKAIALDYPTDTVINFLNGRAIGPSKSPKLQDLATCRMGNTVRIASRAQSSQVTRDKLCPCFPDWERRG